MLPQYVHTTEKENAIYKMHDARGIKQPKAQNKDDIQAYKLNLPPTSPIHSSIYVVLPLLSLPARNPAPLPPLPDILITLHIPPPITKVLIKAFPKSGILRDHMDRHFTRSGIPQE
jgi:hypothetical protein